MVEVLQIRIELLGIPPDGQPNIWRRIQIEAGCSFWDLHVAIQNAMGWTDSHLHMFRVEDPQIGQPRLLGLTMDDDLGVEPGREHKVMCALPRERARGDATADKTLTGQSQSRTTGIHGRSGCGARL